MNNVIELNWKQLSGFLMSKIENSPVLKTCHSTNLPDIFLDLISISNYLLGA